METLRKWLERGRYYIRDLTQLALECVGTSKLINAKNSLNYV